MPRCGRPAPAGYAAASTTPTYAPSPLNDLRAALLAGAELAREPEPPYLYARGLVGCLDAEARAQPVAAVLDVAAPRRLPVPGVRRDADPACPGATRDGLVRRVDTAQLVREIEAAGGRVVHREDGPGHDFLDQPDPHVARLEVRWDPDPTASGTPRRTP